MAEVKRCGAAQCRAVLVVVLMLGGGFALVAAETNRPSFQLALWSSNALPHLESAPPEVSVERGAPEKPDRSFRNVTWPTLTVYLPEADKATGTAVVICPGGGYSSLAIDKEGYDVARWLNTLGVAGLVLKYRLPQPKLTAGDKPWPVRDAERALRLARSRAVAWRLDPHRIGIMGFSAGGHLTSTLGTHFDRGRPDAPDPLDRLSCRPDFMILVYPVISLDDEIGHQGSRARLLGPAPEPQLIERYSNERHVTAETPPAFLVQTRDDPVNVENSRRFQTALERAGVPSNLQLYDRGGHGYGLGVRGGEVATWPVRCAEWMKTRKLLGTNPPTSKGSR